MDELINQSATKLAQIIRDKKASSAEVVEAHLERIDAVNPELNAVVQLAAEQALAAARHADAALARNEIMGPLHGVPMTIKDSLDTADMITTGGTTGRVGFVPAEDATVVSRLRAAGAILLGKTNTPELTLAPETDNLIYGKTRNPYDLSRTPGGSSGGAAAIIAASGSPLDIGSDTGGSVRLPAHCCGIAGLKPTAGRVPRTGHIIPFGLGALDSLTTPGPMARYVEDLALSLPIIAGADGKDPAIVPAPLGDPDGIDVKTLRVAVHTDNGIAVPSRETVDAVLAAAAVLADAGVPVEEDCPKILNQTNEVHAFRGADGGAWIRRLLENAGTTELHPWTSSLLENPKPISTVDFMAMLEKLDVYRTNMLSFMKIYDVILCPVSNLEAVTHDTWPDRDDAARFSYTRAYNLTGWPVAVVRAGTSPDGLPIGVQVVTRPWREDVALAVARHLETVMGGWQPPRDH